MDEGEGALRMITQSEYDNIKEYFDYCNNGNFVARKLGVSPTTANRVRKSKNYDDYKVIVREETKPKAEKKRGEEENSEPPKTMIVSYAQMKALEKDVDSIKESLKTLVDVATVILDSLR